MLTTDQLSHLEDTKRDMTNKKLILDTASDIQALLQLLVAKEIITKEEIDKYRKIVKNSQKYRASYTYIIQALAEIEKYENDPQSLLKEMFNRKLNNE